MGKPNLVMIPGTFSAENFFKNYVEFFSPDYNCIPITLPFHNIKRGNSANPNLKALAGFGLNDYLANIIANTPELNFSESTFAIGFSMGGVITLKLAQLGSVKAVVLISSAAPAGINAVTYSSLRSFKSTLTTPFFWNKAICPPNWEEALYAALSRLSPTEQYLFFDNFVWESGKAIAQLGFPQFDRTHATYISEQLVQCQMLVVGGRFDNITPIQIQDKIARRFKASFLNVPRGHLVCHENGWQKDARQIKAFLDSRPTA
ncbi:MAG: hypothetical protein A2550_03730 [Candidatus Jacksonbacteria bacterium RIFOXYD2_FULL_43_21]|nr:MAG: hypothetical protein A2550_03730 [Candidatus Jacksonbacteria bacterium RIFOXYD2_FULL_43_21]HCE49483.1 hypothetical protein [Candidatus Jacksonbacteria bacterium]